MISAAALFLSAIAISWFFTYSIRWFADQFDVIAQRSWRRVHEHRTPLMGGTGIFLSLFAATYFFFFRDPFKQNSLGADHEFSFYFLGAISLIFLIGLIDDMVELKMRPKITVEFLASLLILSQSGPLQALTLSHGIPVWITHFVLILWMVGITNGMNFLDGIDGMSASAALVAASFLTCVAAVFSGLESWSFFAGVSLCGALLGFLAHNRSPAKIFLGDSGSLLIGFSLSALSIKIAMQFDHPLMYFFPAIVMALPIMDVCMAVYRRKRKGRSPFDGDREHIHHRVQALIPSTNKAVFVICVFSAGFGFIALGSLSDSAGTRAWTPIFSIAYALMGLGALVWAEKRKACSKPLFSWFFASADRKARCPPAEDRFPPSS